MRISDWSSDVCSSDLKLIGEYLGAGEKDLTRDVINPGVGGGIIACLHIHQAHHLEGEEDAAQQHAHSNTYGKIVSGDSHCDGREHHYARHLRVISEIAYRPPGECADGNNAHDSNEGRDRNRTRLHSSTKA